MAIDAGERLDIDDVLSGAYDGVADANILYAVPIDIEQTINSITQMQDTFDSYGTQTTELIDNANDVLAKTNSQAFYTGTEAQQNITNITDIGTTISEAGALIKDLAAEEMSSLITQYNEKLIDIKKNVRRQLLEDAAAEFNSENKEWEGYPKTKKYKYRDGWVEGGGAESPMYDSEFNYLMPDDSDTERYDVEIIDSSSTEDPFKDAEGNIVQMSYIEIRTYKVHKYKQITCTNGFKSIQSPWDPTFAEIEAQFDKVGCKVPYDRNNEQIANDQTKNNKWGIRW